MEQTNPHETAPRQMFCYPSRQRQQTTDNSLCNAITSTFKGTLEYPMPHFIRPWNVQDESLFCLLPLGICPSCLMRSDGHYKYRGSQNHLRLEVSPENPRNLSNFFWGQLFKRMFAVLSIFSAMLWNKKEYLYDWKLKRGKSMYNKWIETLASSQKCQEIRSLYLFLESS